MCSQLFQNYTSIKENSEDPDQLASDEPRAMCPTNFMNLEAYRIFSEYYNAVPL